MNEFNIGIAGKLDRLLATRMLITSGSGGGKSYLIRRMTEELSGHVQQFIFDYEGEFSTLREKFNFALVAVRGGDIPLHINYAHMLCRKLYVSGMSVIFDLYDLQKDDRITFVDQFFNEMMNMPRETWHPLLVYLDEAHIFCPQVGRSDATGSVIDVATRGRKREIGIVLATQRLSKLHKDASAECFNKMVGRTGQDIDQARASEELGIKNFSKISLRSLPVGTFYGFGPAFQDDVVKFKVGEVTTSHGFQPGTAPFIPTPLPIREMIASMKDLPKEADKELRTLAQLHAEVDLLKSELLISQMKENREPQGALEVLENLKAEAKKEWKEEIAKAKQFNKDHEDILRTSLQATNRAIQAMDKVKQLESVLEDMAGRMAKIAKIASDTVDDIGTHGITISGPDETELSELTPELSELITQPPSLMPREFFQKVVDHGEGIKSCGPIIERVPSVTVNGITREQENIWRMDPDPSYNKCERAILAFLVGWDRGFSRWQICFATGYSENSGSLGQAFSHLLKDGLIQSAGPGYYNATITRAIEVARIVGVDLIAKRLHWTTFRHHLDKCALAILEFMVSFPKGLFHRDEMATKLGYAPTSGSWGQAISTLKRLEMIESPDNKLLRIKQDILFNL